MSTAHYALFVDLENCGAKIGTLNDVIEKVKIRGDILIGKVYGYTDQYSDLKEVLLSNTFNVVPSLRFGKNQKNNLDIQLVIDALDVAFTNTLIDSFCIVSGDSDYTPLVGKLKSMGKFVLGISRSEAASGVFINACNEFQFLESVSKGRRKQAKPDADEALTLPDVLKLIETILQEQTDEEEMLASELKNILLRLRPDFNEKSLGFSSFGKLLTRLADQYGTLQVVNDRFNVIVQLRHDEAVDHKEALTRENFVSVFEKYLRQYKDEGFERVDPSILKSAVTNEYPDFSERAIGMRRFSDVLRALERAKLVRLEMNGQRTLLVHIL
jgi:uncharacterized LabA/DUF88 family protein